MTESGPDRLLPGSWIWWEDDAHDGVTNMAIDEALMTSVTPGTGTWRWYGWSAPTVSFGRNERIVGRVPPDRLTASGLGAVRRPTGGRALLHHRELTYSVTLYTGTHVPWRGVYDRINTLLLEGLRRAGVHAELAPDAPAVAPDGPVCFDQPATGEIMVGGRKLVGSAVWRQGTAYLQHGSILLHDDQHLLQRLHPLDTGSTAVPAAATLADGFPALTDEDIAARVRQATREALQAAAPVRPHESGRDALPPELLASHYRHFADTAWLWRR